MDLSILEISLRESVGGKFTVVGYLFRYGADQPNGVIRFVPEREYIDNDERDVLSLLFTDENPEETRMHLADITAAEFNGIRQINGKPDTNGLPPHLLPSWFQNLLPEGVFRSHIAEIRGCSEGDYFELLAACGADLPGAVYASPLNDADDDLKRRLVTQNQDSLEPSVIEIPLVEGISLSGVQPKLGVILDGQGRYVARTKLEDSTHIVAKLPAVDYPLMPEVEHLSMHLAKKAGVDACQTMLEPLEKLIATHSYELGDLNLRSTNFLAIPRYDRKKGLRLHAKDFAQALGFYPHEKYTKEVSYSLLMKYMLNFPSLGESAVLELLRRLAVNELIGNPDCHLKNIGIYYPDGKNPELPPAYDIVAHHVYTGVIGHALLLLPEEKQKRLEEDQANEFKKLSLDRGPKENAITPAPWPKLLLLSARTIRALSEEIGLPYKLLHSTANKVVGCAARIWPSEIDDSLLTEKQKAKMKGLLARHPAIQAGRL